MFRFSSRKKQVKTDLDMDEPVLIGCSIHGYFMQKPKDHLDGHGCSGCAKEEGKKAVGTLVDVDFEKGVITLKGNGAYCSCPGCRKN